MKEFRLSLFAGLFAVFLAFPSFSQETPLQSDEELDYEEVVSEIKEDTRGPYLDGDYVVFTYPSTVRYVGIAFEFENFETVHPFNIKRFLNDEYEEAGSLFFYVLHLPKYLFSVNYRLVVDGLWTTDPQNPDRIYSEEAWVPLSHFDATREIPLVTEQTGEKTVRFVYQGEANQKVRIGGSFTNWDSWIYVMKETSPGFYELSLNLPPGRYEYAYYTGINSFPDRGNPERVYTNDGKEASLLIVN